MMISYIILFSASAFFYIGALILLNESHGKFNKDSILKSVAFNVFAVSMWAVGINIVLTVLIQELRAIG